MFKFGFRTLNLFTTALRPFINPKTLKSHKFQLNKSRQLSDIMSNIQNHTTTSSRTSSVWSNGVHRRFYNVPRDACSSAQHLYKSPRYMRLFKSRVMLSCAAFKILAFGWFIFRTVDIVPYTNRKRLVLISRRFERMFGETVFQLGKDENHFGNILPADDPKSVKVNLIAAKIINGLYRTLDVPRHVKQDEVNKTLCIRPIEKKKLDAKVLKRVRQHFERMKWEVLVADKPEVNALAAPGGKIVINTGFLDFCNTDDEIAACIGHEVGHVVARHAAEKITNLLWFAIQKMILSQLVHLATVKRWLYICKELPLSRRREFEADYIGMLLMASAGYDPRVAPQMCRKVATLSDDDGKEHESTHPSGFKRAKFLEQDTIMSKAISMYDEAANEVVQ